MDLLRSTIKVLFYDFAPEWIAEAEVMDIEKRNTHFYERLTESIKWRERNFTQSEIGILQHWLEDELMLDEDCNMGYSHKDRYTAYDRVFIPLAKCGNKLLNLSGKQPCVIYRHLLRWRDLTLLTGEDLLILPSLARRDVMINNQRDSFCWPNIIRHDDLKINTILSQTLSDTHAHLNASTDVFDLNWIAVMNHPDIWTSLKQDKYNGLFFSLGAHQEYDIVSRYSDIKKTLLEWIEIAAAIRMRLLTMLLNKDLENIDAPSLDFSDEQFLDNLKDEFLGNLAEISDHIIKTQSGLKYDYAILNWNEYGFTIPESSKDLDSPFMILSGERSLFYKFFCHYFSGKEPFRKFAPQVFLYFLIKNKVRREFVQTNALIGFNNFKTYQDMKYRFVASLGNETNNNKKLGKCNLKKLYTDIAYIYAIQSSIIGTIPKSFEARVMPNEISKIRHLNFRESIFGKGEIFEDNINPTVTLIAHFSKRSDNVKKQDGEIRFYNLRKNLREYNKILIEEFRSNNTTKGILFVGVDAAGNELLTPPEVFAETYKELREKGISNFTYHVGEDFYDLIHGLRSIDEALEFLQLSTTNRLGHALALGVDSRKYYTERHNCGIMPKQVLLDNIVWLKFRALEWNISLQPETQLFIEKHFEELSESLGYVYKSQKLSAYHYWEAMKMRGLGNVEPLKSKKNTTAKEQILDTYLFSSETSSEGAKTQIFEFPRNFWKDVNQIQEHLVEKVEHRGIIIETNPSSNFKIGPFTLYSELPIFKLHTPGNGKGHHLPVTVNTDDKGVFATTLENEYSLLAISLRKQRDSEGKRLWDDKEIEDYIKQLVEYGNISRFKI